MWGASLFALRLPALLAGALGAMLVFAWPKAFGAGALAALLVVSNPLWHTFSRLCQTDILHAAFLADAMLCLASDPKLSRRSSFWAFALLSALGIMVKSVAGLLAPLGLLVYWAMARPGEKPLVDGCLRPFGNRIARGALARLSTGCPCEMVLGRLRPIPTFQLRSAAASPGIGR